MARLAKSVSARALVVGLPLAFVLMLATGCDTDGYPADLEYPPRTDPLVVGRADRDAQGFDRPGEYPRILFPDLPEQDKDKLLKDPANMNADQHQELDRILLDLFGTPAHPKVTGSGGAADAVQALAGALKLDDKT